MRLSQSFSLLKINKRYKIVEVKAHQRATVLVRDAESMDLGKDDGNERGQDRIKLAENKIKLRFKEGKMKRKEETER